MAQTLAPTPELGTALTGAYMTLKSSKDGPGKKERAFDRIENTIDSTENSPTLTSLNNFYDTNRSLISSAAAGLSSLDKKVIDHTITGFSESVQIVMAGLDALAQVHPFIGVAVLAFKLVVTLDLTRRENNKKVMAVTIQMQQMMCTLFQLRRVKDPDEVGPDGMIIKDRLRPLIEQIAQDIRGCGSVCDVFLKKPFIAKMIKSKIYEGRLAGYAAKFMGYLDDLDKSLTIHIALKVDAANEKLDSQLLKLRSIESKLDLMLVFRKLDTPREREVLDFIDQSGGSEAVIERDDLVQNLVKKSGETMAKDKKLSKNDVDSVKKDLRQELAEDLDVVFQRNFSLFDRKLEMQNRNIAEAFNNIASALASGAHDRIKDKHLQNVWREMGWKGSVKARHFVLALRDYFTDQFTSGTPLPRGVGTSTTRVPPPEKTPETMDHLDAGSSLPGLMDNKWALQYLNVAHLQSILEAIDDDGTGFVSIKEANTFAIERPKGWSLLHWIAYWAKGWEMSLADYENKIFLILQEMDQLRAEVLMENRYHVDTYISHNAITGVEHVMRGKRAKEYTPCFQLISLTKAHTSVEEERLRKNLENIRYDMDSAGTVTLVTGPGRIEHYLFPLLYLTLRRHLEVFHYACRKIVDSEEFSHMSTTLGSIFDVVDQRIEDLNAIRKQVHVDVNSYLENFALGMFYDIAVNRYLPGSRESLIVTWQDTSITKNESDETKIVKDPENARPIFSEPNSQNNYQGVWLDWPPHCFDTDPFSGTVLGSWTGHFWSVKEDSTLSTLGLTELMIEADPEDASILKGNGVAYSGNLVVYGRRRRLERGGEEYEEIDLVMSFEHELSIRLVGKLEEGDEKLVGQWAMFNEKKDARLAYDANPFRDSPSAGGAAQSGDVEVTKDEDKKESNEERNREKGREERNDDEDQVRGSLQRQTNEKPTPDTENEGAVKEGKLDGSGMNDEVDAGVTKEDRAEIAGGGIGGETNSAGGDFVDTMGGGANGSSGPGIEGGGAESTVNTGEPKLRTFTFCHTPAEAAGFRYLLDKHENKAKARWMFLRESVLHLIRCRLWSLSYLKARCMDRTQFLDFHKRNWLFSIRKFRMPNPLNEAEREVWYQMQCRLPPSTIYFRVEALNWSLFRLPFHYGIECDGCKYCLLGERFICLTCMDPEMSNSFDLCSECKDKPAERHDFTHTTDHTLIKARQFIPPYLSTWLVNEARIMTTRLKKTFTELLRTEEQDKYTVGAHHVSTRGHSEILCGCCAKPVRVPCWVCITCAWETYICLECEKKEQPVEKDGPGSSIHRVDHHLLCLHNLEEAKFEQQKIDPTVAQINELTSTVKVLESRIVALENKMETQITPLEALLRRIALQLKIPDHEESVGGNSRFNERA